MRARDLIFIVFSNLRRMKLRLVLTALGVVIGTSAIVLMVSLGIGLQENVTQSLGELGAATHIQVMAGGEPGIGGPERLDDRAIGDISDLDHVQAVLPQVMVQAQDITYKRQSTFASVTGVPMDDLPTFGYALAEGRWPRDDDEIVLGASVPEMFAGGDPFSGGPAGPRLDLIGKRVAVTVMKMPDMEASGKEVMVAEGPESQMEAAETKRRLTVVGVLDKLDMQTDSTAFVTLKAALDLNGVRSSRPVYDTAVVKVDSPDAVAGVEKTLTSRGYLTFSAVSVRKSLQAVFMVIQGVLGALGGIAMIVAALGITNTMTMSIYERTREIGIMKAVGASNRQIKRVFLGEAAVIGVLGGLGGLALSVSGAALANLFVQSLVASQSMSGGAMPQNTTFFVIPASLGLFAIAFAAGVGLLSGLLPAVRASNLDPLIALRHE
ncbi:MAG: ABC transporter permease [Coriobacteriales bacterium]|nr:ABC transporter permease [Actinomycetes bacterium]